MEENYHPDNVLIAIEHLLPDLPLLVGIDWERVSKDLSPLIQKLYLEKNIEMKQELSLKIVTLLEPYDEVIKQLGKEILAMAGMRDMILKNLHPYITDFHIPKENLEFCVGKIMQILPRGVEADENVRHIRVKPYGVNGTVSMKLSNMDTSIFQLGTLTATVLTTALASVEKLNPLIMALGVLTTVLSVAEASTVKIEEQEGSVLWGFILARNGHSVASSDEIWQFANRARNTIGFKQLEKKEVESSLNKLKILKVVRKISGERDKWRLIESFEITNSK